MGHSLQLLYTHTLSILPLFLSETMVNEFFFTFLCLHVDYNIEIEIFSLIHSDERFVPFAKQLWLQEDGEYSHICFDLWDSYTTYRTKECSAH